ncbi:hypothetical protein AMTRI_Chr03g53400 [Amborella trichopoda]
MLFLSPLNTLLVPFIHGSICSPPTMKTQDGTTHYAISLSPLKFSLIFLSPLSNLSTHGQHIASNP